MKTTDSLIGNLEQFEEQAFHEWLRKITDQLEQPALGITLQVLDKGLSGLSDKQLYIFERYVVEERVTAQCSLCSHCIPWSEMYQARDTGLCSYCENNLSKD
jgi:hypothetical protein